MPAVQSKPISILNISSEKVSINTEALQSILEKVGNSRFVFISINGPKRTGKSFMLSNFIRYLNADPETRDKSRDWLMNSENRRENTFEWRGGSERNTKGIDVWSEPFWVEHNGQQIAILLMDTQGAFDDQTTLQQNAVIFAISTLLSSVLIFNIKGEIGEDILQFFQFFSSYATLTVPETSESETGGAFQNLIFLLRDFQFIQSYDYGYYDDNSKPSDKTPNYKKERIDSKPSHPEVVRLVHDQVTKSFQNIGVYLMPEPGKGLKQLDEVDNLDEDFSEHLAKFVRLILSHNIVTKKVGGLDVTGTDMIRYGDSWAKLFDGKGLDGMPEIKSIYHSAAEQQYIIAKQMALTYYASEMQNYLRQSPDGVSEEGLTSKQVEAVQGASNIYKGRRNLGGKEYDRKFEEEFPEETDRLFETFKATNHANLKAGQIRAEMEANNQKMQAEMAKTEAEMTALKNDHAAQQKEMKEEIEQGKRKTSDMEQLLENQKNEQARIKKDLEDKQREIEVQKAKEIEDARQKAKDLENMIQLQKQEQNFIRQSLADRQAEMDRLYLMSCGTTKYINCGPQQPPQPECRIL